MRLSIRRVYAVSPVEMPTLLVAAQPGDLVEPVGPKNSVRIELVDFVP